MSLGRFEQPRAAASARQYHAAGGWPVGPSVRDDHFARGVGYDMHEAGDAARSGQSAQERSAQNSL